MQAKFGTTISKCMLLKPGHSRSEDILVLAVVVAELKLRVVQQEIFRADLVIAADDPALQDARTSSIKTPLSSPASRVAAREGDPGLAVSVIFQN